MHVLLAQQALLARGADHECTLSEPLVVYTEKNKADRNLGIIFLIRSVSLSHLLVFLISLVGR